MANRKISKNGIKFITRHEGTVLAVYRDPAGFPTVGIGHLLTKEEKEKYPVGTKVTLDQCMVWFAKDVKRFEDVVNERVKVPLTQNQFDALVSFSFNVGPENFKGSTLLVKLNRGDYAGAADQFPRWIYSNSRVYPGLVTRRNDEKELFLTPDPAPAENTPSGPASAAEAKPTDPPQSQATPVAPAADPPAQTPKTVPLPAKTGGTAKSIKLTWQLPTISVVLIGIWEAVMQLVDKGFVSPKELGDKVFAFVAVNYRFVAYVAIAAILYMIVQKILTYVPAVIEYINHADKSSEDVKFE